MLEAVLFLIAGDVYFAGGTCHMKHDSLSSPCQQHHQLWQTGPTN
jgi:hypothetical protein